MTRLIPLLLAALLSGCAEMPFSAAPGQIDSQAWDLRQEALAKLNTWSIKGRLAVIAGDDGWTATLHWNQDQQSYTLRFIAPLGQGTYQLDGDDQLVSLLTPDNRLYRASDPESLMLDNLGWNVPLHGLKYWVKGVPEPDIAFDNLVLDERGLMTDLEQSGWRISISRYDDFNGTQMPGKLVMQNGKFQLRLVVQDWQTFL